MSAEFPIRAVLDDKAIDALIAAIIKAGRESGKTEKEIKEMTDEVRKLGKEGPSNVNKVTQSLDKLNGKVDMVANRMLALFAFEKVKEFGKKVIEVTSEFQKLFAVLENTLGSKGLARAAFNDILEFAAKTPFSVQQLTASFVKLANMGFVPTIEELRKLGDLAASTGKDFDMLTEAIIDAQTGEFERLKEFGIRASKQGDQVTFAFKGTKTQVDFTSESIRAYILSLGDLQGVSGSMAAISKTLGGQISNLSDSFDQLFAALGESSTGILSFVLGQLGKAVDWVTKIIQDANSLTDPFADDRAERIKAAMDAFDKMTSAQKADEINEIATQIQFWRAQVSDLEAAWAAANKEGGSLQENMAEASKILGLSLEDTFDILKKYDFEIALSKSHLQEFEETFRLMMERWNKMNTATKTDTLALIPALEKKLKELKEARDKSFDESQIRVFNEEIRKTQRELDNLLKNRDPLAGTKKMFGMLSAYIKSVREDELKREKENNKRSFDNWLYFYNLRKQKEQEEQEHKWQLMEEETEARNEALAFSFSTQVDAVNAIMDLHQTNLQRQLDLNEMQREGELEKAGDNEEAKAKINKKYDEKARKLQEKQMQAAQMQGLFNMAVSLGPSIAKTVENLGFPLAIPFIAAVGALFATLMAQQKALKAPKFKNGVFDLDGPGTSTSDSIPAWLSNGESVVSAEKSKKYGFFLKPLIEGNEAAALHAMAMHLRGDLFTGARATDSDEMLNELRGMRSDMQNLKQVQIDVDESGFKKWVRTGDRWTQFINDRYSS